VPLAVSEIVMRALAGQVTDRYQRAEDLLQDILTVRRSIVKNAGAGGLGASAAQSAAVVDAVSAPSQRAPDRASDASGPGAPGSRDAGVSTAPRSPTASAVRTRDVAPSRFCWNCRKPLPARAGKCPFCGETQ
jgi:hypothetical protein